MQAGSDQDKRLIAWNGVRLYIPASWDCRVSGNEQLIFEKHFQPLVQIRWHNSQHHSPRAQENRAKKFVAQLGSVIPDREIPNKLQPLKNKFKEARFFQDKNRTVRGGVCLCSDGQTLLLFQLLVEDDSFLEEITGCLINFSFRDSQYQAEKLWRIQDFSLITPNYFTLQNYTFAAGLSRLSFAGRNLQLQTCRLGPADSHLIDQSLERILLTLTGSPELQVVFHENPATCRGERTPTIFRQLVFRLRREKPFISSKIWHDSLNNRLLAVVLSANRPIPLDTLEDICNNYEIIQK